MIYLLHLPLNKPAVYNLFILTDVKIKLCMSVGVDEKRISSCHTVTSPQNTKRYLTNIGL